MNKAYSILRQGTEQKGRSVILEREIFNLQNKNPWEGLLETSKKSSVKLQKKQQQQQQQKFDQKPKTACKTVKIYKCSHPSSQNLNRSDTVLTLERSHSWKYRHPQQSTYPWEVFSADLFAIFKAI